MRRPERVGVAALIVSLVGLSEARAQSVAAPLDSLVLERTACLGTCPVYRLSLRSDGSVVFDGRSTSAGARRAAGTSLEGGWEFLLGEMHRVRFFDLPAEIMRDRQLCPIVLTDFPSAILTVFRRDGAKRVDHYHGCAIKIDPWTVPTTLKALDAFAAAVDSVGQTDVLSGLRRDPPNDGW